MRRSISYLVLFCALMAVGPSLESPTAIAERSFPGKRIWFTPDLGSPDMIRLFQAPESWAAARARISVFKFYEGQLLAQADSPNVLPNDYQALRSADAFRKLTQQWRKRIAIEVAAVKPQFCTADASGMRSAINDTMQAIRDVVRAGGRVNALAMDEPFFAGTTAPACGGPDGEPTLARLQQYIRTVKALSPGIEIGLIEPYPHFSEPQIEQFLSQMRERGIAPAFFHLDLDLNAASSARVDVAVDMKRFQAACAEQGVSFGFILWGGDTDSDAAYASDVMTKADLLRRTFSAWERMPDDLVFQSWALSSARLNTVPLNLPETDRDSHTGLIDRALSLLYGHVGEATARAPRGRG